MRHRKFRPNKPQQLQTRFERWLYFLKFADLYAGVDQELPQSLVVEDGITTALDSMRRAYANDPVRELIEAREKAHKDELNRLYAARREGRLEGLLEAARALRARGMEPEIIYQTLGLSAEQLSESD